MLSFLLRLSIPILGGLMNLLRGAVWAYRCLSDLQGKAHAHRRQIRKLHRRKREVLDRYLHELDPETLLPIAAEPPPQPTIRQMPAARPAPPETIEGTNITPAQYVALSQGGDGLTDNWNDIDRFDAPGAW
jgi:hypothetical protein